MADRGGAVSGGVGVVGRPAQQPNETKDVCAEVRAALSQVVVSGAPA